MGNEENAQYQSHIAMGRFKENKKFHLESFG